jgi:hypothetical protein
MINIVLHRLLVAVPNVAENSENWRRFKFSGGKVCQRVEVKDHH